MDWEGAMRGLSSSVRTDIWARIGEAAKNLCEWLGDDEILVVCGGATNGLKKLKRKEDNGGGAGDFGCI